LLERGNDEEASTAKAGCNGGGEHSDMGEYQGTQQPNTDSGNTDHIRDDLVIEVDDGNDNQSSNKREIEEITP